MPAKNTPEIPNTAAKTDILSIVAFFEGEVSMDWLGELTGERPTRVLAALEDGVKKGWLSKKGPGVFLFSDKKIKEELKSAVLSSEQERLHKNIAGILLKELPEESPNLRTFSTHLLHIKNTPETAGILMKAGDHHLAAFETETALKCFSKVLDDLSGLRDVEADSLFTQAALKYSKFSVARHDTAKVKSLLAEAMTRAKRTGNVNDLTLLKMHMAKTEWLRGNQVDAFRLFGKAWRQALDQGNPGLLQAASAFRVFFFFWQGRYREAIKSYEESVPAVERFPSGRFSLSATMLAGFCYALTGQVSQGLGMLDAVRKHSKKRGDRFISVNASFAIAVIVLEIGHLDEGIQLAEEVLAEVTREGITWVQIIMRIALANAYYHQNKSRQTLSHLRKYLKLRRQAQIGVQYHSLSMELSWAMEQGRLPHLEGMDIRREVLEGIKGKDTALQGIAYRFQAYLNGIDGRPTEEIVHSLERSAKCLEEAGHELELNKTRLELVRYYSAVNRDDKAEALARLSYESLKSVNESLFPDDLRHFLEGHSSSSNLLMEILRLGQEVGTIRDHKELVQHIISTVNRLVGAERGAIFSLSDSQLELMASKNLTADDIADLSFRSSMKLIEKVSRTGQGRIESADNQIKVAGPSEDIIRSCICVPMIIRNKVVGVLYHDNRLLSSAFKESDSQMLAYFAGQAAIALDNSRSYEEIQRASEKLREEKLYYEEEHHKRFNFEEIIGKSEAIRRVTRQINQVAETESTVLVLGDTGVGKELVASAIHRRSNRRENPFIRVHCSALPEQLIPSELFGHEKGAFTGASQRRIGRFELADGGTLFLDEVGDLTMDIQVRLLRVLQTKEFERVGGNETLHSNFRLIAATNRDLESLVRAERFRADLYYRLNVFPIQVPPLRDRKSDIALLANHFLKLYSEKMGKFFKGFTRSDLERLEEYDWPGNVRELENIIERSVILSSGPSFRIPDELFTRPIWDAFGKMPTLGEMERGHIERALRKSGWKVRGKGGAAELLDIKSSTLEYKMKKHGIERPKNVIIRRSSKQSI